VGTTGGTLLLLVGHAQTLQVAKSKNDIQSMVSNNVTDSDSPGYSQYWIVDIPVVHQPLPMAEVQPAALPGDHLLPYQNNKTG
jgi:hypothetical protein